MLRTIALVLVSVVATASASAADNGVYLGLGIAQASVNVDLANGASAIPIKGDATKFKIIGGVRPLDWLAFEINYVDFGSIATPSGTPTTTQGEYKLKGYDVFAVGLWEIAIVDLYAKVGAIRWNDSASIAQVNLPSKNGYDLAYGGGIQVHMNSLGVRAEYEKFNIDKTNVDLISVAVTWTFL